MRRSRLPSNPELKFKALALQAHEPRLQWWQGAYADTPAASVSAVHEGTAFLDERCVGDRSREKAAEVGGRRRHVQDEGGSHCAWVIRDP
jgi:hypothetical protein